MTLAISVEDTGVGIPSHVHRKLFDPFHQGDSSMKREFGGTGIGLSISKKLVKLMDGTLRFSSGEGIGSVFEFTVKVARAPETTDASNDRNSGPQVIVQSDAEKLRDLKVLLLDEHPVRQVRNFKLSPN